MTTSATDGYSPAAASEPPTIAIDGAAVRASAAVVAATSVRSLWEMVMRAATQPTRRTCGPLLRADVEQVDRATALEHDVVAVRARHRVGGRRRRPALAQ